MAPSARIYTNSLRPSEQGGSDSVLALRQKLGLYSVAFVLLNYGQIKVGA